MRVCGNPENTASVLVLDADADVWESDWGSCQRVLLDRTTCPWGRNQNTCYQMVATLDARISDLTESADNFRHTKLHILVEAGV